MSNINDVIKSWIEKGDHDKNTAELIKEHIPEYRDTIAFQCQQATEKYIKAWMISRGLEIRKTHDLVYLLELINEKETVSEIWFDKASALEDFGVEIRYPDTKIQLSDSDIVEALLIAKEFREFIITKLNL